MSCLTVCAAATKNGVQLPWRKNQQQHNSLSTFRVTLWHLCFWQRQCMFSAIYTTSIFAFKLKHAHHFTNRWKKSIAPVALNYISGLLLQLSRAKINRCLEKGASYGTARTDSPPEKRFQSETPASDTTEITSFFAIQKTEWCPTSVSHWGKGQWPMELGTGCSVFLFSERVWKVAFPVAELVSVTLSWRPTLVKSSLFLEICRS